MKNSDYYTIIVNVVINVRIRVTLPEATAAFTMPNTNMILMRLEKKSINVSGKILDKHPAMCEYYK